MNKYIFIICFTFIISFKLKANKNDSIKYPVRERNSIGLSVTTAPSIAFGSGLLAIGHVTEFSFIYYPVNNLSLNLSYTYGYQNNIMNSKLTYKNNLYAFSPSVKYYFDKRRKFYGEFVYLNGVFKQFNLDSNYKYEPIKINSAGLGLGYSHLIRKNLGFFNNKLEFDINIRYFMSLNPNINSDEIVLPAIIQGGFIYNF